MATLDELRGMAAQVAAAASAPFIGTEHLFLAWLRIGGGGAHEAAVAAGLTAESFERLVHGAARREGSLSADGPLRPSPQAERALAAAEHAAADGGRPATADDLILALLREPRGPIARALQDTRVPVGRLRALLKPASPPPAPREPRKEPATGRDRGRGPRDADEDVIPEAKPPERPRLTPPPRPPRPRPAAARFSWFWPFYMAIPLSVWLHLTGAAPLPVFAASAVAIVPLAGLMATATEELAARTGATLGALLNATFGNATEMIVAIAALSAGYVDLVKASVAGSILSNLLLVLGLALITGGARQSILRFDRTSAGAGLGMLALATAAMMLPTLLKGTPGEHHLTALSFAVAVILVATYAAALAFTTGAGRREIATTGSHRAIGRGWPVGGSVVALAIATILVAVESEILVDAVGPLTRSLGWSEVFVGLIVVPMIGNAAEHATAVVAAHRGRIDLAVGIAVGSSTQIALLVAPVLIFVAAAIGAPMTLVFPPLQILALAIAVIVTALIVVDGESHWLEGVQLIALYGMIAAAAWFI